MADSYTPPRNFLNFFSEPDFGVFDGVHRPVHDRLVTWIGRIRRVLAPRGPSPPTRQELIDHKHRLEGEIRQLNRRINAGAVGQPGGGGGESLGAMQSRLERLRAEHLETRLRIDRTPH